MSGDYIYVAWWGVYSHGGEEGNDPYIARVPDGDNQSLERYIRDELVESSYEHWQSEHWRGVECRRLTPEEVDAYLNKQLLESVTVFVNRLEGADKETVALARTRVEAAFDAAFKNFHKN